MSISKVVQKFCVQTAVYWGTPVADGYGKMTFAAPVEIACRWENTTKLITAYNGKQIACTAIILLTQDVVVQGMLYLGTLDDLDSAQEADPYSVSGAYEIKRFDKVPAVKSTTEFVRKAFI